MRKKCFKMLIFIVLMVASGLFFQGAFCQATGAARCPDGYSNPLNGTCYLLSHDKEPWVNAVMSCQLLEGHLVEIETNAEAVHLKKIIQNKGALYWIALSNKRNQSSWEWATSHKKLTPSSYTDWAPGEPDDHAHDGKVEESCVAMDNDAPLYHQYQWADIECYRKQLYVCEAKIPPILPFITGRK